MMIVLFLMLLTVPAWAVDRWVSPGGGGGSCPQSTPCSLSNGIAALQGGDHLVFTSGNYGSFNIGPSKNGTSGNPTTLRLAPGANVTIDCSNDIDLASGGNTQYIHIDGAGGTLLFTSNWASDGDCITTQFIAQFADLRNFEQCCMAGVGINGRWDDSRFYRMQVHHNGRNANGSLNCDQANRGGPCHGFYIEGHRTVYEEMDIHHNSDYGIHRKDQQVSQVVKNSYIHENFVAIGSTNVGGGRHLYYNNRLIDNGQGITGQEGAYDAYNNTIVTNSPNGVGMEVKNPSTAINNIVSGWGSANICKTTSGNGACGEGSSGTVSQNLCIGSTQNCAFSSSTAATFRNAGGGDYHPVLAGPACGVGANLIGVFGQDAEGNPRVAPWDVGYTVCTTIAGEPNPEPGDIVAKYTFETGSGTNEPDDTGFGHTGTWNSCPGNACRGNGIIGTVAGSFVGGRVVEVTNTAGLKPTPSFALAFRYRAVGTPTDDCDVSMGDSYGARIQPDGNFRGFFDYGPDWRSVQTNGQTLNNGMAQALVLTYDKSFLRAWINNANVATLPATDLVQYKLGPNFRIGSNGNGPVNGTCSALIDQVYVLDGFCDPGCVQNLYNEQVSQNGLTMSRYRFVTPDTKEGINLIGVGENTNIPLNRNAKVRLNAGLERVGSTLNEFFPLHARVNGGARTRLMNSCATFPVCITTDAFFAMGDATNAIYVAWDAAATATGYKVSYGTAPGVYTTTFDAGNVLQAYKGGLTPGTRYYFAVKAYNVTGDSAAFSNEVSAIFPSLISGPLAQVPGRYVVDTIDTAATTFIADGEKATQSYTIAFGTGLNQGDVVQFEPSYSNNDPLDGLPATLPQVTIQVTSTGHAVFGGTFTGVRVQ